jgi:hypothetical protein
MALQHNLSIPLLQIFILRIREHLGYGLEIRFFDAQESCRGFNEVTVCFCPLEGMPPECWRLPIEGLSASRREWQSTPWSHARR